MYHVECRNKYNKKIVQFKNNSYFLITYLFIIYTKLKI